MSDCFMVNDSAPLPTHTLWAYTATHKVLVSATKNRHTHIKRPLVGVNPLRAAYMLKCIMPSIVMVNECIPGELFANAVYLLCHYYKGHNSLEHYAALKWLIETDQEAVCMDV